MDFFFIMVSLLFILHIYWFHMMVKAVSRYVIVGKTQDPTHESKSQMKKDDWSLSFVVCDVVDTIKCNWIIKIILKENSEIICTNKDQRVDREYINFKRNAVENLIKNSIKNTIAL